MNKNKVNIYFVLFVLSIQLVHAINTRKFPDHFKFGASNAAPQIEGAYLTDGKSESIWDHFAHTRPDLITDHSNLDVAADSYHKYKEDVAALKGVGMQSYRLSFAWTRIFPNGYTAKINAAGVQYYKKVIKELKDNNIEPMVTLYHWDLPQVLQDQLGGWLNESVTDLFAEYARVCFKLFGEDVKWWVTINEPKQVCLGGYEGRGLAPGVGSDVGGYICSKNVLLAHAKAYRIYDKEFRGKQGGKVSMVIDSFWFEPGSESAADQAAAERTLQFYFGLYGHPIYNGDWPQVVKQRVAMRSKLEGYKKSRLPELSRDEIELIKGTHDYLGLNHYTSRMVNATTESPIGTPSFEKDVSTLDWQKSDWLRTNMDWFRVVPWGLRKHLAWLKKTYGNPEIVITENGIMDGNGTLADDHRVSYIRNYLSNCLDAIYIDKVNLTRYYIWSIIDDFEWSDGYHSFLGIYRVNFTDPNRTRTPRKSASYFKQINQKRCLVEKCTN